MSDWLNRVNTLITASGMTQQQLAGSVGVDRTTLSRYLNGHQAMPSPVLMELLQRIGATVADLQAVPNEPQLIFRSDDPRARQLPQVEHALRRFSVYAWLEDNLAGKPVHEMALLGKAIYEVEGNEFEIADWARKARVGLGLAESGPLPNIISYLQQSNIKVLGFAHAAPKPDGFSAYHPDWGYCLALNVANRPVERIIFTAAHELGHLVFRHAEITPEERNHVKEAALEKVANLFAGHFLAPSDNLRNYYKAFSAYQRSVSLPALFELKTIFGVSLLCILVRLLEENLITGKVFGSFKKKLYPNNSVEEPMPLPGKPDYEQRLRLLALAAYEQDIIGEQKLAEILGKSLDDTLTLIKDADIAA